VYLVDKIDSLQSGLLNELYARGVIDLRDMEQLKAEQTQTSCNEKLLSMLGCKSSQQFEEFLSSLRASGQDFVADQVLESDKSTNFHYNDTADNSGNSIVCCELEDSHDCTLSDL
jgi:Caspase recruitment domain